MAALLDGQLGGITYHVLIAVLVFMFAATEPWQYNTPPPFNGHHISMGMSLLRQAFEVAVLANEVKRVHQLLRSI